MKDRPGRPWKDNVTAGSNTDKSRIRRTKLKGKRDLAARNTRRMEKILLWEIDREGKAATIRSVGPGEITLEGVRSKDDFDRAWYRAIRKLHLWTKWREFFSTHRPTHPGKKVK